MLCSELNWSAITSTINVNDLIVGDNQVYASTDGGILSLDIASKNIKTIDFDDGVYPLDLSSVSDLHLNHIIVGSSTNGSLQRINLIDKSIDKVIHLDWVESINKIVFVDNLIFAIAKTKNSYGVLEYIIKNDKLNYIDYYENFPIVLNRINDIDIFNNELVVSTDNGILYADHRISLHLSDNWRVENESLDVTSFENGLILDSDSNIIDFFYDDLSMTYNAISDNSYFEIINTDTTFLMTTPIESTFTSVHRRNNIVAIGLENSGICLIDRLTGAVDVLIPNSIHSNEFSALSIYQDDLLVGIGRDGLFKFENDFVENYVSLTRRDKYSVSTSSFVNTFIDYVPGSKLSWSVINRSENEVLFSNSGIPPFHPNDSYGGVVKYNFSDNEISIYDTTNSILDGLGGVLYPDISDSYITIHQIKHDINGNSWIVNPYAENSNNILAIFKNDDQWTHVQSPDYLSFLPQEISFGPNNTVWVSFRYLPGFSSGGIKILSYGEINSEFDNFWYEIDNLSELPELSDVSVWSIEFSKIEGQDLLWVLTSDGVLGYIVDGYSLMPIYPTYFYPNLPFVKGDKLRSDSQGNVWVLTQHSGVRVIKPNTTLWPSADGIRASEGGLLSDIVYDVAFGSNGSAYLATNKGISVLGTPIADYVQKKEILLSPNPFILADDNKLSIWNFPVNSKIEVKSINGLTLKTFNLGFNENRIDDWDGVCDNGSLINSGVYYIVASKNNEKVNLGKLAVIK